MIEHIFQNLRGLQAVLAFIGMGFSFSNLRDAIKDKTWLQENGYNGLRAITAEAQIFHEAGRLLTQFILFIIGICGLLSEFNLNSFERRETLLDTFVIIVIFSVSAHSRHVRKVIREYIKDNKENV